MRLPEGCSCLVFTPLKNGDMSSPQPPRQGSAGDWLDNICEARPTWWRRAPWESSYKNSEEQAIISTITVTLIFITTLTCLKTCRGSPLPREVRLAAWQARPPHPAAACSSPCSHLTHACPIIREVWTPTSLRRTRPPGPCTLPKTHAPQPECLCLLLIPLFPLAGISTGIWVYRYLGWETHKVRIMHEFLSSQSHKIKDLVNSVC